MKHKKNKTWGIEIGSEQSGGGVDTFTLEEGSKLSISNTLDTDVFLNIKSDTPWELVLLNEDGRISVETVKFSAKVPTKFNQLSKGGNPGKDLSLRDLRDKAQTRDFLLQLGQWTIMASAAHTSDLETTSHKVDDGFSLQGNRNSDHFDTASESEMSGELSAVQRLSLKTSELFGSKKPEYQRRNTRRGNPYRRQQGESTHGPHTDKESKVQSGLMKQDDRHLSTPILRVFSIGLLTLGIALLLFNLPKFTNTSEYATTEYLDIDSLLMEKAYAAVAKETAPSGQVSLSGYISTNAQLNTLKQQLANNSINAKQDIVTSDSLVAAAQDIFRVNAIDADITTTSPGIIEIVSYANDTDKVRKIENEINDSLRLKEAVAITNQAPIIYENKEPRQIPVFDDQKRITLVVAGDEGYVMTADESRYFIGSTLPSGHQITKITGSQVHITKQDESITLNFN